jgi:hypothetical protein
VVLCVAIGALFLAVFRFCKCPLYEPAQPYMAIRLSIIGCAAFVILCVMTFLLLGSAKGAPPPVPVVSASSECDSLCRLPRERYRKLDMCREEHIAVWRERAKMKKRGRCSLDIKTGRVSCNDSFDCQGGITKNLQIVHVKRSTTVDCAACHQESEELRVMCCDMCQKDMCRKTRTGKLAIAGQKVDKVVCAGCDKDTLHTIANHERDFCHVHPGHFRCKFNASCHMGVPEEKVHDVALSCDCNPCSSCGDDAAKAQCCVECLEKTCALDGGTDHAKRVCSGCSLHQLRGGDEGPAIAG